ncbi:MAG: transporter substrate-binding domain-containing protein [Proteobacteria bacterium]|nr:transporter substrate-binding domain-containing protein [Pseudomonadota bacterium]MBU1687962.1 transporter substrate-binding domain-containing protein [Pseudomonadota bacterium]
MFLNKTIIFCLLLMLLFSPCTASEEDTHTIGSDAAVPLSTPEQTGMLDLIVKEAFARVGEKVTIIGLPSERSLLNANQGVTDGDLVRIVGLENQYPNLVMVPEKIWDFEFVAFSKNRNITLSREWKSLDPYSVGIITGWKILEQNIHAREISKVSTPELLFTLLDKDRVDLVIYNRIEGYGTIKTMHLQGISVIEPTIESREMFLYLNKKHGELAQRLAEAIRQMKEDGTFADIVNKSLQDYLP